MSSTDLQASIIRLVPQLTTTQQLRLLEVIHTMLGSEKEGSPKGLLKFVGVFEKEDLDEMELALKDCERIDEDGWSAIH